MPWEYYALTFIMMALSYKFGRYVTHFRFAAWMNKLSKEDRDTVIGILKKGIK